MKLSGLPVAAVSWTSLQGRLSTSACRLVAGVAAGDTACEAAGAAAAARDLLTSCGMPSSCRPDAASCSDHAHRGLLERSLPSTAGPEQPTARAQAPWAALLGACARLQTLFVRWQSPVANRFGGAAIYMLDAKLGRARARRVNNTNLRGCREPRCQPMLLLLPGSGLSSQQRRHTLLCVSSA